MATKSVTVTFHNTEHTYTVGSGGVTNITVRYSFAGASDVLISKGAGDFIRYVMCPAEYIQTP